MRGSALLALCLMSLCSMNAVAAPRTRAVADPEVREALAEARWADAEAGLRLALAEELAEIDASPPREGWGWAAAQLEQSRQRGLWQADWQVRNYQIAREVGDYAAAARALDRARATIPTMKAQGGEGRARAAALDLLPRGSKGQGLEILKALLPWLLCLGGAAVLGRAADRVRPGRRALPVAREALHNPYVTGRPLRDVRLVFGREAVIREVTEALQGGSQYLTGERRIGKTTLLLQIGEIVRGRGGVSLFMDMAGTSRDDAARVVDRALRSAARARGMDDSGALAGLAERLAAAGPLLFLVDEVDALNGASVEARALLRRLALDEGAPGTMLAAGVGLRFDLDEESRRWEARLAVREVRPLPGAACRALLVEPVAEQVYWSEPAVALALERSEGRPLRVQLFGLKIIDRLGGLGRRQVAVEDVEAVSEVVDRAWRAIQDRGAGEEAVPVDLDSARLELGRLYQEINRLKRALEAM